MRTAAKARAHVFMRKSYLIEGLKSTSGRLRDDGRLAYATASLNSQPGILGFRPARTRRRQGPTTRPGSIGSLACDPNRLPEG